MTRSRWSWMLALALLGSPALAAELGSPGAKIVNGVYSFGYPSVGLFLNGSGLCSGTLIGCNTFLTAAHCVCTDFATGQTLSGAQCQARADLLSPAGKSVFFQHAGWFAVSSVAVDPAYTFVSGGDFAVLHLAAPVTGIAPSAINALARPPAGTAAQIAGFGSTRRSLNDTGLKRAGAVVTSACSVPGLTGANLLCWRYAEPLGPAGTESNSCTGDSGGPLFADLGAGTALIGVTSAGTSSECTPPDQAWDSDVFRDRAWIQGAAGADLGTASCGGLPAAATPNAAVLGGSGSLSAAAPRYLTTLEVPAGASRLRVTLNGQKPLSNDYALAVRRGAPPTAGEFDCRSDRASLAVEACEIVDPPSGTWHLLADYRNGTGGPFQLTATVFTPSTAACVRDAGTACLQGERFEVDAAWQNAAGSGVASIMSFGGQRTENAEAAFYSFQSPANFEMGVKVLNACIPAFGNKYWVFISGLTDQGWTVTVRDTRTGAVKTYSNPIGHLSTTFADTAAFDCE
jgi:hypothetical protein